MAVGPHYSDRVVALFNHVSRVHVFWYHVRFKYLSAVNFIDAECALALKSQMTGIDLLQCLALVGDRDFARRGTVAHFLRDRLELANLFINFLCNLFEESNNGYFFRKSQYEWRALIRHGRHFLKDGNLK